MTFVRMVKVTVVQVVDVAAVTYRGVATTWTMLMSMVGMGWGGASRHGIASFRGFRCADAAARILRDVYESRVGKSGAVRQGRFGTMSGPDCRAGYANPFPENEVWSYPENAVREKVR
jgi:hypothetical protein